MNEQEQQIVYAFAQEFAPFLSWLRENREALQLAATPAPAPVDLEPMRQRLAALEEQAAPDPVDLSVFEARLAALEAQQQESLTNQQKIMTDINRAFNFFVPYDDRPILERLAALEAK